MRTGFSLSLIVTACLVLAVGIARAVPVTVDTVTTAVGDTTAHALSHPTRSAGGLLLVAVHYIDVDSSESVSYGGVPLSLVHAIAYSGNKPRTELWQLTNPSIDTAEIQVLVADGRKAKASVAAVSLIGVDLDKPIDTCITKAAKTSSGSIVISSEQADLVLAAVTSLANGEPSPSIGSTMLWSQEVAGGHYGQGTSRAGAGSVNIGWAYPENKEWAGLAANINHKNFAPVLGSIGSYTITEGDTLQLTITAVDEDGTIPNLTASGLPADAKFKDNGDGTAGLTFISDQTSEGTYNMLFVANDGSLADSQLVTLTVIGENTAPILDDIGPQAVALGDTLTINFSAVDIDGTDPILSVTPALANAVLIDNGNGHGSYVFAPDAGQVGVHTQTFIAGDGLLADSEVVEISVVDTSQLAYIRIEPAGDTSLGDTSLTADDSLTLFSRGYKSDHTLLGDVAVVWSLVGSDTVVAFSSDSGASTTLNLRRPGTGRIAATYGAELADTTGIITCTPGVPNRLEVSPDNAAIELNDTIQFSATAYDTDSNLTDAGALTWYTLGHTGDIDPLGLFVSTAPGTGRMAVATDRSGAVDTTGLIIVQAVLVSPLALGTAPVYANDKNSIMLAFSIDNYYETPKTVTSLTIRNGSRGTGTFEQVSGNLDSIALYIERDDSYYDVSLWDTMIARSVWGSGATFTSPCSLVIEPGAEEIILLTADICSLPHDGDTLDFHLIPAIDIGLLDSTVARGPATVNSFGHSIVDGMTAGQIAAVSIGSSTIAPDDTLYLCAIFDLPRNGYAADTLSALEFVNSGTASVDDIDSLLLFADDGDDLWEGRSGDNLLSALTFTGQSWSRSGLALPLVDSTIRLFVAARLAEYPNDGTTISLQLPLNGIRVISGNDGPLDLPVYSPDTLTIEGREAIAITSEAIPARSCVPGLRTGPLVAVKLTNGYTQTVGFDSITLSFTGTDPQGGTPAQLASQIDSVFLYLDKDNAVGTISPTDSLIATGFVSDGSVIFTINGLTIGAAGGSHTLVVDAKLNLQTSKNGNTVAFTLADSSAIVCDRPVRFDGSFPVANTASFTIDAFPATAVAAQSLPSANLYAGQHDRLVFAFDLPRNGYATDKLSRIDLVNNGSLSSANLLRNVRLWMDVTGNGLTVDDPMVGEFRSTGSLWRLSDLRVSLNLPATRFIVTVSISDDLPEGGTLQFGIPVSGVQYLSGTIGPDDEAVVSPTSFLVFPFNRVTVVSIPNAAGVVFPGSSNNLIMTFALYNGYVGQIRTLTQVTFTNSSHTAGTAAFSDHELGQVSMYWDANKNRVFDDDTLVGTGLFKDGTMRLDGLSAVLAPESLAYFFVVADVPSDLIDADSLSVSVEKATDFAFKESVALNGDLPLSSGGPLVVNGSVRRQYELLGPNGRSLSPGDTNITLMIFSPAANGTQIDLLQGISVDNTGTADTASVSELALWHDVNRDSVLDAGDSLVATLGYGGGIWSATGLALPVSPTPPILLIAGNVSETALPNTTLRLEIPLSGCEYQSANDGPLDSSLVAPGLFTVSTSGLRVAFNTMRYTYSVGQAIDIAMTTTNVSASTMDSITAELVSIINPTRIRFDSSTSAPVTLAAGQSVTSHHYFTAIGVGGAAVRLRARSRIPVDSSVIIQTPTIYVQQAISPVAVHALSTGPTAVTKGQTNVLPLSLECPHPNTSGAVAAMTLDNIRLRVTDGQDGAIAANTVFSRLMIATGFDVLAVLPNAPSQSEVAFTFDEPVTISPGSSQSFMLIADISADASASFFKIAIDSAAWIPLLDDNTGQTVPHATSVTYPIRTASSRIDAPSQQIAVSGVSCVLPTVNYGQLNVDVLKLSLRHPGEAGSSSVQLTSLALWVKDSLGVALPAADLFSLISLHRQAYFIGEAVPVAGDTSAVEIHLSTPVTLSAQEIDSIYVAVTVEPSPGHSGFQLMIADSSSLVVRDLNTGAALVAVSDTSLVTGDAFPIASTWTSFRMPAQPPIVCPIDISVGSVAGGADSVPMIAFSVAYPVSAAYSSVILKQARLRIVDSSANPVDVDQLFSRIGYRVGADVLQYSQYHSAGSGYVDVSFGDSGLAVAPGDTLTVRIMGDLHLESPATEFAVQLADVQSILAVDASDSQHSTGVAPEQACSGTYPFSTSPTSILLPAGRPFASRSSLPVQMAPAGSQRVVLFDGDISYTSASPLGRIELRGMTVALARRASSGVASGAVNASVDALYLEANGVEIGIDTVLSENTVTITAASPVTISRGENLSVRLTCDLDSSALPGNVTATFTDSSFLTIVDKSLLTPVYPIFSGQTYPIKAGELSVVAASLETSFTNYPNPFNPANGDVTTIGFVLTEDATVDIDIFTLTGESVCRITSQSQRGAGAYQIDTWAGLNGDSRAVQPGVYYCRITATYGSGRVDTFRRKIAVIR